MFGRNEWVSGKRTIGEEQKGSTAPQNTIFTPHINPTPDQNAIYYRNEVWNATGDLRIIGVLGLHLYFTQRSKRIVLLLHPKTSTFFQKFLWHCGVIIRPMGINPSVKLPVPTRTQVTNLQNKFGTLDKPLSLFKMQYDIINPLAPPEIQELKNLDKVVPGIRTMCFEQRTNIRFRRPFSRGLISNTINSSNKKIKKTLIIHTKKKSYQGLTNNMAGAPGVNYHEQHKFSYSLALAVAMHASKAGWDVFINDDGNRFHGNLTTIPERVQSLLSWVHKGNTFNITDLKKIKVLPRNGSLIEQYADVAEFGEKNVIHLGGRSGHLEFMIYLGQKVIYVEEPNAEGEDRISTTLCSFKYQGEELMKRLILIPTTAGGRAEHEYRYELLSNSSDRINRSPIDFSNSLTSTKYPIPPPPSHYRAPLGVNPVPIKRITSFHNSELTVDYYKIKALHKILNALGLSNY
nr:hypothetical protein GTC16762_18910 [Pigmentibacter ruber]